MPNCPFGRATTVDGSVPGWVWRPRGIGRALPGALLNPVQREQNIKLYRSYLGRAACYVPRHRGKSPHQAAYFTRSLRIQQQTAVLASYFALAGLVPAEPSAAAGAALPDIARGGLLCTAFETYATLVPTAAISFEYAVFLAECLARGDQLRLGRCCECGGMIVVERFPIRDRCCQHCTAARSEAVR